MLSKNCVSFVMTADELVTADVTDPMSRVGQLLMDHPIHHIPVLEGNKLVGIISTTDLLRVGIGVDTDEQLRDSDRDLSIEQVMETRLVTLHPKDSLLKAAKLLAQESFNSLPVVDEEGELVGILTTRDLLRYMVEQD